MSLKVLLLLCLTSLCLGRPNPAPQYDYDIDCGSNCKIPFLNLDNFYLEHIFTGGGYASGAEEPVRSSAIGATQQRRYTYNVGGYQRYQSSNPYNQNYRQTRRGYYRQPSRSYTRYYRYG